MPIFSRLRGSGLFWFGLLLLLAELVWRPLLPYQAIIDQSVSTLRNPLPHRAWPEYIARNPGDNDIVLLGNSQAVGLELPDEREIYPGLLEQQVRARSADQPGMSFEGRLLNWSVSGLKQIQLELLTIKALESEPAALVFVVSLYNFSPISTESVRRDPTDIPLLIGAPGIVAETLRSRTAATATLDSILLHASRWWSALLRSRIVLFDHLATVVPKKFHKFVFGHRRDSAAMLQIRDRRETRMAEQVRPLQVKMDETEWLRQFRIKQLPQARKFLNRVVQRVSDSDTRLFWVWMPFALREDTRTIQNAMKTIHREFCDALNGSQVACFDLIEAVDPGEFISGGLSSHLSPGGHRVMANRMHEVLSGAIYQR